MAPTMKMNATTTATKFPSSTTASSYNPPIYVEITFAMPWETFCTLSNTFQKKLAALLSKQVGSNKVLESRINFINIPSPCANVQESATVQFYVSKEESSELDKKQTVAAYELLNKYHKDKNMEEIVPEFKGKVEAVEIKGTTIIPTTQYSPPVTVIVIFKMSLDNFCLKKETFRKNLAEKIGISPTLIVFVNLRCRPNVAFLMDDSENVKVEFYVKAGKDSEQADAQLTNKAYELLDDYVKNNKMGEIHPDFEGKVESLQIKGEEKPTARKSLLFNQNERLLMGVGAAAVIILIAVLILVVRAAIKRSRRQNSHQLNDEEVMAEEAANGNIELEPINETKAEIMVPPQYNSAKDGGVSDDGEKKDICPLAESEKSSINELDIDRATEGPSVENPAFVHDEGESKKANTEDVKIDEKKVDDTKTAETEDQTQTPTAETNAGYDDQSDSPSEENTSL
ncbi:hypothetical protein AC249_AIPGENE4240 [Exaiptasia diaphana]|nr:hypothetical protein AC249_AIPGENE4240 [Exaiptasia diaphana]